MDVRPKPHMRPLQNGWWACGQYDYRGRFISVTRSAAIDAFFAWRLEVHHTMNSGMYWELFP